MFYQIPCTGDLLTMSGMPLALMVQPFSLPHPSEEPIQVHFGHFLHLEKCFFWTHVPQSFERDDILIVGNSQSFLSAIISFSFFECCRMNGTIAV
jgi:hypothetical protein